jgi:DNA-binding XRE family transcriptional regulator
MLNKQELKAVMALADDTQEKLANALGITSAGMSGRINGRIDFSVPEIDKIIARYKLSAEDIKRIFFTSNVT